VYLARVAATLDVLWSSWKSAAELPFVVKSLLVMLIVLSPDVLSRVATVGSLSLEVTVLS
jgi:hypothetical protein